MIQKLLDRLFGRSAEKVFAHVPTEPVLYRFRALQDFWSAEVNSQYAKGGVYSVRKGNAKLGSLVEDWERQRKVEVI